MDEKWKISRFLVTLTVPSTECSLFFLISFFDLSLFFVIFFLFPQEKPASNLAVLTSTIPRLRKTHPKEMASLKKIALYGQVKGVSGSGDSCRHIISPVTLATSATREL